MGRILGRLRFKCQLDIIVACDGCIFVVVVVLISMIILYCCYVMIYNSFFPRIIQETKC